MISAYWESRCWLLGDSGYGHEPLLHIPILDEPRGAPEEVYTRRHCRDRNTVERCIGVLKARWRQFDERDPVPINMAMDQGEDVLDPVDIPELRPRELRILANQELRQIIRYVNRR
ncbi:hypothetical protein FOCC_FOCC014088 [Frankliniella occidentalis]|nr:hypothetical protein FOCC_FOCC014088 [Frankliniella occidentalis]